MYVVGNRRADRMKLLLGAAAVSVLAIAGAAQAQQGSPAAGAAQAQPASSDQSEAGTTVKEVVVTGIKASLASSLREKRNAPNEVDSISAEEVGKFPENNLAESLQRIAGVAVVRSYGIGQQISVRGLGPDFQEVLLNGRALPSDTGAWSADGGGSGRSFNFDVLPSEMISRVDVNKTAMPELTEGGIGATIDINTPRPLDIGKTTGSFSASANMVENRKEVTPTLSGIGTWVNDAHTFGVSVAASYTNLLASENYYRVDQWDNTVPGKPNSVENIITGSPNNPTVTQASPIVPRQMSFGQLSGGTERYFVGTTTQWKPVSNLVLTADAFYSNLRQVIPDSEVHPVFGNTIINPTYASDGVLTSGTYPGAAYLSNPAVQSALAAAGATVQAPQALTVIRERDRVARTYEVGFNAKWDVTSQFKLEGDVSYAAASGDKPFDPYVLIGENAQGNVGFKLNGPDPTVSLSDPVYSNPSLARLSYSGNWSQTIDDNIFEARLTGRWRSNGGILKGVEGGLDFQDHDKGLGNYNPASDSYDTLTYPVDPSLLHLTSFNSNFGGLGASPVSSYLTYNPRQLISWMSQAAQLNARPLYSNTYLPGGSNYALMSSDLQIPGGPLSLVYDQGGSFHTRELVTAGYVDTKWGGDRWSGNVGLRIVNVSTTSNGWGQTLQSLTAGSSGNYVFNYSAAGPQQSGASYWSFLPSANFRYNLTNNMLIRLAASETLSRADLNALRYGMSWGGSVGGLTLNEGNPALKPQYGANYDVSWEWYLSKLSYVSVAGFYKDLSNLFQGTTKLENVSVGGVSYQAAVNQTVNVASGKVDGVELAAQYALDERFGWLSGFGVSGNYTHVDTSSSSGCGVTNVSPDSLNGSGFYDNGRFQVRALYNWRSAWATTCNWDGGSNPEMHAAYGQLDMAVRVKITDAVELFADGTNLTDSSNYWYWGNNRPIERSLDYRRFDVGLRAKF